MTYRLNVRCCCQPTKILGTLDVRSLNRWQQICWVERLSAHILSPESALPVEVRQATIEIKSFGRHWEMAVYSDDRPIEFWRKIPGFIEGNKRNDY